MQRRAFLTALAGAVAAAASGCTADTGADPATAPSGVESASASSSPAGGAPSAVLSPPPPAGPRRYPVPSGTITVLPGDEPTLLLGIDDGVSAQAISDYCQLATDADLKLVFFGNGCYQSWRTVRPTLGPLVESGRIQLANHTLDHPKLTRCSDAEVARQLRENAAVFQNLYGVNVAPWFRPPYGLHNDAVDRVAAAEGYHPPVIWTDAIPDWTPLNTQGYISNAQRCFQPRSIVLAHANKTNAKDAYPAFVDLIRSRGLRTVTLTDVFDKR